MYCWATLLWQTEVFSLEKLATVTAQRSQNMVLIVACGCKHIKGMWGGVAKSWVHCRAFTTNRSSIHTNTLHCMSADPQTHFDLVHQILVYCLEMAVQSLQSLRIAQSHQGAFKSIQRYTHYKPIQMQTEKNTTVFLWMTTD